MKFITVLACLVMLVSCSAQQDDNIDAVVQETERAVSEAMIYVSADLHWQREDAQFRVPYLDEIIDTLLFETVNDAPDALLLCGDLTNDGKLEEHIAVSELLAKAESEGAQIFVTMGNHDMYGGVSTEEIKEIYADFGFNSAISSDSHSMSYLAKLNDELWIMSLDLNVYGDKKSTMAATISDETLAWVESCLLWAKNEGALIVPFSHHNLVEHAMDNLTMHYNIDRGDELQQLLINYNIPIYLSGHRHGSFVATATKENGEIHELVVDMIGNYPQRFTTLSFNDDATISYENPSIDVAAWAEHEGLTDNTLLNFSQYSLEQFEKTILENSSNLAKSLTEDVEELNELIRYYIDIFTHSKSRTLGSEYERLLADPALDMWEDYGNLTIFGRWMPWMLENHKDDSISKVFDIKTE